jgi:hypothetical protein
MFQKDTLVKAAALMFQALDEEEEAAAAAAGATTEEGASEEKGEGVNDSEKPKRITRLDADGEVTQLSVESIEALLAISRSSNFAAFSRATQRRVLIFATIAQVAHGQRNVRVTQWAAREVLQQAWDPSDPFLRHLIDRQVDMHFLLADCLVERLADMWIDPSQEDALAAAEEKAATEGGAEIIPGPRVLGTVSEFASEEIKHAKSLVCLSLQRAVELCQATEDQYGLQNAVIYFWNLHLPLFRQKLYASATDEVEAFLKLSLDTMQKLEEKAEKPSVVSPGKLDGRLKANLVEAVVLVAEARQAIPAGLEVANKFAADISISVYSRRKLSELSGRLAVLQAPGKSLEAPKLDHPLLSVYHLLAQSELPGDKMPAAEATVVMDKATAVMKGELQEWIDNQGWADFSRDEYNEVMEMRAECWCRLTRGRIAAGDVYGSQDMAEQCMNLVSEDVLQKSDERQLSPRVWRWLAICERYFGLAIQNIINPDGMDKSLQDELSLAALRHFNISCGYALRASREELLVEGAIGAWNASMHLIDSAAARHSLLQLQRQIIDSLLTAREDNMEAAHLKQQFYLAFIECMSFDGDWDAVLEGVFEAFDNVPIKLQKPLWKWRVVALSKKGKNVLDGIQKLKEGDPSLQARVYGILARASADPKQQLEAYRKTIEILGEDIERVDYELETAQWMASAGVPRVEVVEVVQGALDCLYEVEEKNLVEGDEGEGKSGANDAASQHSSHSSSTARSKPATGTAKTKKGSASGSRGASRAGGSKRSSRTGSRAGSMPEEEVDEVGGMPADLRAKQLEQGVRSLAMLAMLSSADLEREERAVEALYFVRRFFETWSAALKSAAVQQAFWKLSPAEREETPLEVFAAPAEALEGLDFPLDDPLAMLRWAPSEAFAEAMKAALQYCAHDVPTSRSLPALPLTLHYTLWLASCLEQYGFSKHALLVLAFARAIFMQVRPENHLSALAVLQFRAMGVLGRCGLHDLVDTLPKELCGKDSITGDAFVATFGDTLIDPLSVKPPEESASEALTVFGFSSWTQALEPAIDSTTCALELCRDLVSLGQTAQARTVAGAVRRDFIVKRSPRGIACVGSVLAELDVQSGRLDDALASVLAQSDNLEVAGDATELWRQMRLAVAAYQGSARQAEAKRVCLDVIATLAEFCSIRVEKESGNKPPSTAATSRSLPPSAAGSVISGRSGTSGGTKGMRGLTLQAHNETSLEVTSALCEAVHAYVDMLLAEADADAAAGKGVQSVYAEVVSRMSRLEELVGSVCGSSSILAASVFQKRGVACAALLEIMHARSATPGHDAADYSAWLEVQYTDANSYLQRSVDIRRGLLSRISFEEQSFLPLVAPPAKVVEEVVDPKAKGKAPKKGAEPEPEPESAGPAVRLLSVPLARDAAFAELSLARQSLVLARLRGDQLTGLPPPPAEDPTVIDRFLDDTRPPVPMSGADFRASEITAAASLAASATQLLSSTEHASRGSILHAVSGVMRWCGSGAYDGAWIAAPVPKRKQEAIPAAAEGGEGGDAAPAEEEEEPAAAPEVDARAEEARATLASATTAAVAARMFEESQQAAVALVDAFGNLHGGAARAAPWLMLLQSLQARSWLLQRWHSSLNPASAVFASLQRLVSLESLRLPAAEARPQIAAELAFLQASSPAWRRLACVEDPAVILAKLPARTVVVCVQVCPSQKAVYACAGLAAPVEEGDGAGGGYVAGGKWVVDKMPLEESQRRLLLTLGQQQRKWKDDAAKFVAVFGENVSPDQDMAGVESQQAGKLGKVERALEERLRALLADLELALGPLLGAGSAVRTFLDALLAPPVDGEGPLSVLLLADPALQDLPWEGLSCVQGFHGRVGRDFSVHLQGHRQEANPDGCTVKAPSLATVFDPFGDDPGSKIQGYERPGVAEVAGKLASTVPGAGSWKSLKGSAGLLTLQDWIGGTGSASTASKVSVLMYAPGRLGSLLSPSELASLDLGGVLMLQAVDQGLSDAAFRRQNTLDNTKRPSDISKEDPLNMAALASLAGAGCVSTHLWSTTLAAQRRFVETFWAQFAAGAGCSNLGAMASANLLDPAADGTKEERPAGLKPWIYLARAAYGLIVTYSQ